VSPTESGWQLKFMSGEAKSKNGNFKVKFKSYGRKISQFEEL
jgi:hypothetical protein